MVLPAQRVPGALLPSTATTVSLDFPRRDPGSRAVHPALRADAKRGDASLLGWSCRELTLPKFVSTSRRRRTGGSMSSASWVLLICAALVVVSGALLASSYNRLVTLRNRWQNAWAQIDVQLKRRYDLIPNLVEAVKGYMAHERQTLEAGIQA